MKIKRVHENKKYTYKLVLDDSTDFKNKDGKVIKSKDKTDLRRILKVIEVFGIDYVKKYY